MLRRLAGAALVFILAGWGTAQALGLGDIRLQSALNEPFRAEIDLLSVTPEELRSLTVQLAAVDTFRRYGLDRPAFLGGFRFTVSSRPGDRGVVTVTSAEPVTEPFVTFLAEAVWPRGRLLREYTVLLDPPTFSGAETSAPAAVSAPATASTPRAADAGSIRRPAEPRRAAQSPSIGGGDTYRVQRSDTLWGIAERVRPDAGISMNQVMVALYEANPEAFDGNINLLREGAVLRIPSADSLYGINRGQANAEVSRQNSAWRADSGAGSLRLVPPDETQAATPSAGSAGTPARPGTSTDTQRVRQLEAELAEKDRLLAIRNRELAELRQQLADSGAAGQTTAPEPVAEEPAVPGVDLEADVEAPAEGEIFADDGAAAEPAAEEPSAVEPEEEEATTPPARTTPPAVVTRPAEPSGSWMDTLTGLLGSIWTYIGLGVVAIGLLLAVLVRRRSADTDSTGTWQALDEDFEDEEEREATERLRSLARDDDSILVVEQEDRKPPRRGAAKAAGAAAGAAALLDDDEAGEREISSGYSLEDTFSSETAINLDQSDPLAEADFHMAYGLYDQAADLIRNAISADPDRSDLKAKLAEVYFVWGNKDAFVDAAENLHDAIGGEADSDWDKIVIMGQQIAPDHKLFAGGARSGGAVDLSFDEESGVGTLDVDFGADDQSGLDMDFGGGEESGEADLEGTSGGLDFVLDEAEPTGTNEMLMDPGEMAAGALEDTQESPTIEQEAMDEITQETPTIESPAAEITQETPTIESPAMSGDETSELPAVSMDNGDMRSDQTAEIDLDDLGLDLDSLEESGERSATVLHLRSGDDAKDLDDDLLDRTGETQVLSDEDATLLAPSSSYDTTGDEDATMMAPVDPDFAATEALPENEDDDTESTGRMPALGGTDVDLDLDDLTAALKRSDLGDLDTPRDDDTVEQPAGDATTRFSSDVFDDEELDSILDLDVGEDLASDDDAPTATSLEEAPEGRTQTEVGTKLDLARAYIDMGDPDGARSILQEVLDEGDEGQRQEANRLMEALPG